VLRFDLVASRAFDEASRELLMERLGSRLTGGVLEVAADDTRSQWRNRQAARRRLAELLRSGLRPAPPPRRRTRPSGAARRRRIEAKRRRSETKRLRRPPEPD
jgi:ribosome-associated protein